jgi:hypothetical protein
VYFLTFFAYIQTSDIPQPNHCYISQRVGLVCLRESAATAVWRSLAARYDREFPHDAPQVRAALPKARHQRHQWLPMASYRI